MKFGLSLVTRGAAATAEYVTEMVALCEAGGFHSVWVTDHQIFPKLKGSRYPASADGKFPDDWRQVYWHPFTMLAFLAARTTRLRLGTSVLILPMHNPIEVAKQVADIDRLSGGRVNFGVGVGWFAEEFETLGYGFKDRGARANEGLEICKALWTQDPVNFAGTYHTIEDGGFGPKPVQSPHPPIYIGGDSPPTLRRMAKYGDAWHPIGLTPAQLRDALPKLGDYLAAEGRGLDDITLAPKSYLHIQDDAPPGDPMVIGGRPADLIDTLKRYRDVGAAEMVFNLKDETADGSMTVLRRFIDEVMPKV